MTLDKPGIDMTYDGPKPFTGARTSADRGAITVLIGPASLKGQIVTTLSMDT